MPEKIEQIIVYTDGASRGNPGPAAAGFVLTDHHGTQLQARAFFIGQTTNNVAEYTAFVKALEAAKQTAAKQLVVFSDSELLVRQISGKYKVKSEQIRPLFQQAVDLLGEFENWKVQHITREKNKQADKLVNQALNLKRNIDVSGAAADVTRANQELVRAEPAGARRRATSPARRETGGTSPAPAAGVGTSDEPLRRMPNGGTRPIRLGVLISGGGTTLMNILEYIKQGRLNAEVAIVISSRSTVAGVERAKAAGLNVKIIRKKDHPDIDQFSKRIEEQLVAANVDLIIQGGWLCLWKIPLRYLPRPSDGRGEYRVMNIHPALLPSFGGKGMWGHHVHEAVIAAGCKVSGCTVHFCTNEYDKGPIILQRSCRVEDDDTPETLADRVFEQECIAYPQAIKLFAEGKIVVRRA